jgi:surface antigen
VRNRSLAALLAVTLMAAPSAAQAFNYRFLRSSVLKQLTPADIEIGTRATREALDSGTDGEWTNPATGATGTIRILGTVDVGGHQGCRRTRLDVTARGRTGGGEFTLCRTPSGTWNFHNPPR